jgi:hypothetical protein
VIAAGGCVCAPDSRYDVYATNRASLYRSHQAGGTLDKHGPVVKFRLD